MNNKTETLIIDGEKFEYWRITIKGNDILVSKRNYPKQYEAFCAAQRKLWHDTRKRNAELKAIAAGN